MSNISPATRKRIVDLADRLGYRPNGPAALLSLSRRRSSTRGLSMPVAVISNINMTSYNFWRDLDRDFSSRGMSITNLTLDELGPCGSAFKKLWHQGFEGLVIFSSLREMGPEWLHFPWDRFSVINFFHEDTKGYQFHAVRHNAFSYMFTTLANVFARGYRNVVVFLSKSDSRMDDLARIGAALAFQNQEMPADGRLHLRPEVEGICSATEGLDAETVDWLRRLRPDAVVGFPFAWIGPLRRSGFKVPDDFAFAAVLTFLRDDGKPLTAGCEANNALRSRYAVERMRKLLQLGEKGMTEHPVHDVVEPTWRDGPTMPFR